MKIKLDKKYKITLIIISILLLLCVTISISYAYWQLTHNQTGNNNLATGCFEVTFEETGNNISLKNTFPIIDQEGLELTPYKFKIKNTCTIDSEYYVTLNSLGNTNTLINENSIKYAFDFSTKKYPTPKILGTASENTETSGIDIDNLIKSYYLKGGYLRAGEEKEFSLYLWMDQDAPMSEMNKTFTSKIYITNVTTNNAPLIANLRVATSGDATTNYLNGPLVKNSIEKLEFVETNKVPSDANGSWDVSEQQNGAIMAWYYDSDKNGKFEVYIGQEEGVIANQISRYLFQYLTSLTSIDVTNLDTSNVTNMQYMFYYCTSLTNLNLNSFNTSKVTSMSNIFEAAGYNSTTFTLDVSNFDTSNVTDMGAMFASTGYKNTTFTLDISNFDTSKVTNMPWMFRATGYNSTIFTLDISNFDTSKVTNMRSMFDNTGYSSTIFTLDLGDKFNTSRVTDMSYMFSQTGYSSTVFTLNLGDKFDTSNVITMQSMFNNTGRSSMVFTLDLRGKFDTSKVTNMFDMFYATGFNSPIFTLNLGDKFNTSNVTTMYRMFSNIGRNSTIFILNTKDQFYTSKVIDMSYMFSTIGYNDSNFIIDLRKFNFDNVTSYDNMFNNSKATHTAYVKNASDKTWVSGKGFAGSIIDCSTTTCP